MPWSSRCTCPSGTQYRTVRDAQAAPTACPTCASAVRTRVTATMIGFKPRPPRKRLAQPGTDAPGGFRARGAGGAAGGDRGHGGEGRRARRRVAPVPPRSSRPRQVAVLPSIKRSTRDLTRLDPRSDGNFSLRGPQLALQQRLARRLVLQQPVRPGRSGPGRPDQRRAGAVRRRGAGPGLPGAVRRPRGWLHRRQHQHGHQERHQRPPRIDLLLRAERDAAGQQRPRTAGGSQP